MNAAIETLNGDFVAAVLGGTRVIVLDSKGDLFTSDDNGQSFLLRSDTPTKFEALYSVENTVIAVSLDSQVLRSSDNGTTWTLLDTENLPDTFNGLRSVHGYAVEQGASIWMTVGHNATTDDNTSTDEFDGSRTYLSTDDGLTWSETASLPGVFIHDVIWTGSRWILLGNNLSGDGKIYYSTDGSNWLESVIPTESMPLSALEHDGAGVVIAVGGLGEVLRSVDDGLTFTDVLDIPYSGDFRSIAVDTQGIFYLGGDEKTLLQLNGTDSSFLSNVDVQAQTLLDVILINDILVGVGNFGTLTNRTIPLEFVITKEGTKDFRLTLSQTLTDRVYFLETSTDLKNPWVPADTPPRLGTGSMLYFDVSKDTTKRFWRVVEQ